MFNTTTILEVVIMIDYRDQGRDDELELLIQEEEERDNEHYFLGE